MAMNKIDDKKLIGKQYGKLTLVDSFREKRNRSVILYFKWKCSCGHDGVSRYQNLKTKFRNNKLSCKKCIIRENVLNSGDWVNFRILISQYKSSAKLKNHPYDLSIEYAQKLFEGNCHYCGCVPSNVIRDRDRGYGSYVYNGIDRLDNNLGYIYGNVVSCCKECNYKKGAYNKEKFLSYIERVYKHSIEGKNV